MSYVPATFTAGFALMLTAAGAVGGQWVSETFAGDAETPKKSEIRTVTERPRPISRTAKRDATLVLDTTRMPQLPMTPQPLETVLRPPQADEYETESTLPRVDGGVAADLDDTTVEPSGN